MYDFLSDKKPWEHDTCFSYCLLNTTNYVVPVWFWYFWAFYREAWIYGKHGIRNEKMI